MGITVKAQDFSSLIESMVTAKYSFGLLTNEFSILEMVMEVSTEEAELLITNVFHVAQ
jgi:hypothetical protein